MRMRKPLFNPHAARKYIETIAMCFEDPDDLSEFIGLCDMAQAVLAYWLIQDVSYYRVMEAIYDGSTKGQPDFINDLNTVHNKHRLASVEFEYVKQSLKIIISKLEELSILDIRKPGELEAASYKSTPSAGDMVYKFA